MRINIHHAFSDIPETLQTSFDALKQENAALAEAAENGSNAGWIRKVNDKLKNIEMKVTSVPIFANGDAQDNMSNRHMNDRMAVLMFGLNNINT